MKDSAKPIVIPVKLKHDRAMRRLLTAWLNAHARFRVCKKRVNANTVAMQAIEKARRKEQWVCVAKILDIEHTLLRWLGTATHHPDLWVAPSSEKLSRRNTLLRAYYEQRALENRLRGPARRKITDHRTTIVAEIRALEREWMAALLTRMHPTIRIPGPLPLHPRELMPRKVSSASKMLRAEVGDISLTPTPKNPEPPVRKYSNGRRNW